MEDRGSNTTNQLAGPGGSTGGCARRSANGRNSPCWRSASGDWRSRSTSAWLTLEVVWISFLVS